MVDFESAETTLGIVTKNNPKLITEKPRIHFINMPFVESAGELYYTLLNIWNYTDAAFHN